MCVKIPRLFILYYGLAALWFTTTAMHIPDGYLSPVTSLILFLAVLPFWMRAVQRLREKVSARNIPVVALVAAFSFVIMLFNVPLPGGTSGHAVGGALAAIILGPEIAVLALSTAIVIQALLFGDGGILAIGANCFNMAVVLPYISYAVYQALSRGQALHARRRVFAAALAGWSGLTAAAFFAAVEFGIQPLLWHTPGGVPLYAPYPLSVAIPAMVIPHALVASVVEGLVTALVVAYLQRAKHPVLAVVFHPALAAGSGGFARLRALWVALPVLAVAAPIGLLAPGTAWGEWNSNELSGMGLGFVPAGMQQLSNLWSAPMGGYNLPVLQNANLAYILSAAVGILVTVVVAWLFSSLAVRGHPAAPETGSGE